MRHAVHHSQQWHGHDGASRVEGDSRRHPEHLLHSRVIALVEDLLQCAQARKAGLRREEVVIAIILYTGPNLHDLQLRAGAVVETAHHAGYASLGQQPIHLHAQLAGVCGAEAEYGYGHS